jgi:hypothetical protein
MSLGSYKSAWGSLGHNQRQDNTAPEGRSLSTVVLITIEAIPGARILYARCERGVRDHLSLLWDR